MAILTFQLLRSKYLGALLEGPIFSPLSNPAPNPVGSPCRSPSSGTHSGSTAPAPAHLDRPKASPPNPCPSSLLHSCPAPLSGDSQQGAELSCPNVRAHLGRGALGPTEKPQSTQRVTGFPGPSRQALHPSMPAQPVCVSSGPCPPSPALQVLLHVLPPHVNS